MKRLTYKHWLLILLVVLFTLPVTTAYAQGPGSGDKMVVGGRFTLESGETLDGDLVVLGGTVDLETGSTVEGDVAVIGGSVFVDGRVEGDVAVIGGSLRLGPNAFVDGDAVNFGGSFIKNPGAVVDGDTVRGFGFEDGDGLIIPDIPPIPEIPRVPDFNRDFDRFGGGRTSSGGFAAWLFGYFLQGVSAVVWAAILAALGVLLVMFAPKHTERVSETAERNMAVSFGAGCMSWIVGIPLIAILAVTICLIPLSIVLALALVIGSLFGWLALGWIAGKRLMKGLKAQTSTPVIEMVVGVAVLTLVWRMPQVIPFIGWFITLTIGLIVGSVGLGAVFLTRFGTRDYNGGNASRRNYPPSPLEPSPADLELEALPEPEVVIELPPPDEADDNS